MEFGPRALGSRSILADPRSEQHRATLNLKVKFRESFRPFAPSVLAESASDFFEMGPARTSPYMLFVFLCKQRAGGASFPLPATTHVDGSARVQTVDSRHGRYQTLLRAFEARTGCPVLINTSFNLRGEPIVCSPEDAYRCFLRTNLDALVLERQVLIREEQPDAPRHELPPADARFPSD
jgi:carbamoyltransferase